MKNIKPNLTQDNYSLESKKHTLFNLFLNKNKANKAGILKENKNIFITENSINFDSNVIIKENSQFLPKIKNFVNEYQNEQNKLNYWPTTEENNDSPNIFDIFNENIDTSSNTNLKKTISIEYFKLTDDNKNKNTHPFPLQCQGSVESNWDINENKKTFEIIEDNSTLKPAISISGLEETTLLDSNIVYQKKVEISKLNKIKKGSLINNKVIEHLNYNDTLNNKVPALTLARGRDTTIFQYLNTISNTNSKIKTSPNLSKKYGTLLKYNKINSYNFLQNKQTVLVKNNYTFPLQGDNKIMEGSWDNNKIITSEIIEETYKLLFFYFKSIYCLISKPVISTTPDKVKIQLFYYLTIPKKKIIKLFAIHYLKSYKNKWIKFCLNKKTAFLRDNNLFSNKIRLPFIKGKARKSISRLKSKPSLIRNIIFNLIKFNIAKVFSYKFKLICDILSSKFNKPVELELIRLHNPYLDSNILANLLHLNIKNKKKKPKKAIDKIYSKNQVKKLNDPNLISINNKPAFLSGLNFYINGRTMGEAIIPRMTTKTFEKGATATGKVNLLDKTTITKKNKKGAYTIKVISAQNFY
jgi:Mitochondrial ribosomal protein (VAR1)